MWYPFKQDQSNIKEKRMTVRFFADDTFQIRAYEVNPNGLTVIKQDEKCIRAWRAPSKSLVFFNGFGNIPAQRVGVVYDLSDSPLNPHDPEPKQTQEQYEEYAKTIATRQCHRLNDAVIPGGLRLNRLMMFGAIVACLLAIPFIIRAWPAAGTSIYGKKALLPLLFAIGMARGRPKKKREQPPVADEPIQAEAKPEEVKSETPQVIEATVVSSQETVAPAVLKPKPSWSRILSQVLKYTFAVLLIGMGTAVLIYGYTNRITVYTYISLGMIFPGAFLLMWASGMLSAAFTTTEKAGEVEIKDAKTGKVIKKTPNVLSWYNEAGSIKGLAFEYDEHPGGYKMRCRNDRKLYFVQIIKGAIKEALELPHTEHTAAELAEAADAAPVREYLREETSLLQTIGPWVIAVIIFIEVIGLIATTPQTGG